MNKNKIEINSLIDKLDKARKIKSKLKSKNDLDSLFFSKEPDLIEDTGIFIPLNPVNQQCDILQLSLKNHLIEYLNTYEFLLKEELKRLGLNLK